MAQNPIVTITMTNGDIMKAELYPEIAPNTVNNFISLVKKGFYDGRKISCGQTLIQGRITAASFLLPYIIHTTLLS